MRYLALPMIRPGPVGSLVPPIHGQLSVLFGQSPWLTARYRYRNCRVSQQCAMMRALLVRYE
ncbi:hypothetical protein B0T16DRAFT_119693 [Cercophora newfieldiana]|uniref:Uncharacterized protein n=1 Tax=Cercophora newfieldiana TaxID=92897 RepID=A0AA39YA58_9PEZI|nr:hypothetical protein B0T16DRAFT_119693 [Cercophora newfieldiana]